MFCHVSACIDMCVHVHICKYTTTGNTVNIFSIVIISISDPDLFQLSKSHSIRSVFNMSELNSVALIQCLLKTHSLNEKNPFSIN